MTTLTKVKAELKKYLPSLTDSSRKSVLVYLAHTIQEHPDLLLHLLQQGTQALSSLCASILSELAILSDCLEDALREIQRPTLSTLDFSVQVASRIQSTSTEYGRVAGSSKVALEESLKSASSELVSKIVSGTARRSSVEAATEAEASIKNIFVYWSKISRRLPLLSSVQASLDSVHLDAIALGHFAEVLQQRISEAQAFSDKPKEALTIVEVGRYLLQRLGQKISVTAAKYTGDVYPAAPCIEAQAKSSRSGPYRITSANKSLELLAQAASQVFTLPESPAGKIELGVGPFIFTGATKGSVSAVTAGPYNTPVRSTAADGVFSGTTRLFTSASASFLSTNQVGDYIVLSGAYVGTFYIEAILDNTSIILSGAGSAATGINYSTYRDNRLRIAVRGTLYSIPLTVGSSVAYSTWEAELSTALSGIATVSSSGGLITIEDAGAAGMGSEVQCSAGEAQSLMGIPTTRAYGTDANNQISVRTETGTDSITISPNTYSVSTMVTEINSKASALWEAEDVSSTLFIKSTTQGQASLIELTSDFLTYKRCLIGYGRDITTEEIVTRINDTRNIGLVASSAPLTIASGLVTQTAASLVLTDTTKDFTALGVVVGDIVVLQDGPNIGSYHVDAVGTTTLTLRSSDAIVANWKAATSRYIVQRDVLILTSTSTNPDTKIGVPTHAEIGFNNENFYGTTSNLQLGSPAEDPASYGITTRDYISPSYNISRVTASSIALSTSVATNSTFSNVSIYSQASRKYSLMKAALDTWLASDYAKIPKEGIHTVLDIVIRAFRAKAPLYVGEAQQWVTSFSSIVTALKSALDLFTVPEYEGIEDIISHVIQLGHESTIDHLKYGDYTKAFSYASAFSNSESRIRALLYPVASTFMQGAASESTLAEEDFHDE